MKLIIYRSSKGDCLRISHPNGNGENNHILIDGGMKSSFNDHVAPNLNKEIKNKNEIIDLLCLSHIDDDHIVGVNTLMELLASWRVFNHHNNTTNNTANVKKPNEPEPPNIKSIWHNSFSKSYELGEHLPQVVNALLSVKQMTLNFRDDTLLEEVHDKAATIEKGIILSQRIRPEQLNIELNPQYNGKVVKCNQSSIHKNAHSIGDIKMTVIGPFSSDLTKLKKDWIEWEKNHKEELEDLFTNLNITTAGQALTSAQISQLLINSGSISELGVRKDVTIPNLASIMFLAEADGKTILMTGDGHADDILKGLKKNKKLSSQDTTHVNVLKIQHHGAGANIDLNFCKKITAEHYVFCGNGTHTNPEEEVIDVIFNSRRGDTNQKSENAEVDQTFTFWFSDNPENDLTILQKKHLNKILDKLKTFKANHSGFKFKFMPKNKHFQTIEL